MIEASNEGHRLVKDKKVFTANGGPGKGVERYVDHKSTTR